MNENQARAITNATFDLVKIAIVLAIVRHGLECHQEPMDEAHMEEIAIDAWNAAQGIETCIGTPCKEWTAFEASLRAGGAA